MEEPTARLSPIFTLLGEEFPVFFKLSSIDLSQEAMASCEELFGPMADWSPFSLRDNVPPSGRYRNYGAFWDAYISDEYAVAYLFFKQATNNVMELKLRFG